MPSQADQVIIIERRVEDPGNLPWYLLIGGVGATGAVFGGIAWAFFWLRCPEMSPRMEIGRWIAGGTLLAGLATIIFLIVKAIAQVAVN